MKKIISIILTAVMLISIISASVTLSGATTYITDGDWLLAIYSDDAYLIGGYNGTDTELVFPETANGKPIIGVAEDFADKCDTGITSVTIPDSFTIIEMFAFYGCDTLETVDFPSSLTSMGTLAFGNCTSLSGVDLSVTSLSAIPSSCFSGCTSLSSVQFPETLTAISSSAFSNTGLESVTVPTGVTSLGSYCFNGCSSLESVVLPNGLVEIGGYAFYNDTTLSSVYVPVSVSSIGAYAFHPMGVEGGSLTIDCYADTYAASYAYDNFLNYTGDTLVKGDVDNDGDADIRDVTYIQLYRVDMYEIASDAKIIDRVDVTGDYKVTIRDATKIQLSRLGLDEL